jgi:hypothetical protein
MFKKMLILTAAMLVSANLFCDITIENQTPSRVIAYVEGESKIIQPKQAENFKITVKAGKTLDGIPFAAGDTIAKWVVLNEKPVVYRSLPIELPVHLTIKPDGRNYWAKSWYGKAGLNLTIGDKFWGTRFYGLDRVAEISDKAPLLAELKKW